MNDRPSHPEPSAPAAPPGSLLEAGALRVPSDRVYFALLEGLPARPTRTQLGYAFEPRLPIGLDEVETRFARLARGRYLAAGIEHAIMQSLLGDPLTRARARSVHPADLGPFGGGSVGQEAPLLARLEFRSGRYECPRRRRCRTLASAVAVAGALVVAAGVPAGMLLRAQADALAAASARQAIALIAQDTLGPSATGLDPSHRLQAARAEISESLARSSAQGVRSAEDRAGVYFDLLACWPRNMPNETTRLRIDQDSIHILCRVKSPDDHTRLMEELSGGIEGWDAASVNLTRAGKAYQSTAVFRRQDQRAEAGP